MRNSAFAAIAGIVLALLAMTPAIAQQPGASTSTAAAVLDNMEAGDFEAATANFNAKMKGTISAVQLAGVQLQLESAGALLSRGEPVASERDGHTVLVYRIQRKHAAIDATIALDAEGKVAGLHFAPVADAGQ